MNIISKLKGESLERKKKNVQRMASDFISLSDSEGRIYIAYQGNPLILIDEDLAAGEVMVKLKEVRQNYIDSKLKELC